MGKKRLSIDEVKERCAEYGWVLLSDEYNNKRSELTIQCSNGHISTKSLERIEEGRGCKECSIKEQRIDFNDIREKFSELGLTILTDTYKNAHTNIPCVCERGHYIEKSWHSVRKGQRCKKCAYEDLKGKGNPNYNHNLDDELRGIQRNYIEYYEWRRNVLQKDNYTCVACGHRGGKLTPHHILNYSEHIDLRTDITNGATMCFDCHKEFHKIYGRKSNNGGQLKSFILAKERLNELTK